MKKYPLFALFSVIIIGTELTLTLGRPHHCTYVFYYQPVCGNDLKTYINTGHLTCEKLKHAGLEKLADGQCPTEPYNTAVHQWDIPGQPIPDTHQQWNNPNPAPQNPENQTHNAFVDNSDPSRSGNSHHLHNNYGGNYPGNGNMRWDNSREYQDNSFEIKIGGGHGGGMGKGLIAGAILGKVASDYGKKHQKLPGGQYPAGQGGVAPNPYQQPNPYARQPVNPYPQQPNPYPQQPKPYPVQPNPYNAPPAQNNPINPNSRPSPYNPYAPSAPVAAPKPAPVRPAPAPAPSNTGSGRTRTSGRKSGGGGRRKGRSVQIKK